MNLFALRGLSLNQSQELDPLLMAVPRHAGPDHPPVQGIERCEQSRRPVTLVVVGHRATATLHQWQPRLCSVERLNLALLIDTEHQCMLRGIQVKAHDIVQFLDELRIATQLEGSSQMRLQAVSPPDTTNRARAEIHLLGQTASAPVSRSRWRLLRCLAHDLPSNLFSDRTPPPRPRSILHDAGDPLLREATTPNANGPAS